MQLNTSDRYGHASRLAMLFAAWFVPATALDLVVSWTGVHHFVDRMEELGIVEGNPYTDFSSVGAYVVPEVIVFAVGFCMVFCGGMLKQRRLAARDQCEAGLSSLGLRAFRKEYDRLGVFATILILIPMVIAVGRVEPVINNLMWLLVGWGPTALFGPFTSIVACLLAVYPAFYMIQKLTLRKERSGGSFRAAAGVDGRGVDLVGCG